MATSQSTNPKSNAVATALADALNEVSAPLSYIGELCEIILSRSDSNEMEALATSIRHLADDVHNELEKRVDLARSGQQEVQHA